MASSLLPAGRIQTEMIARSLARLHGGAWPERDLRICAVRASDGRRVVFGTPGAPTTDVGTAVAASCAIPSYFSPVHVAGHAYVDGGAHSPSNADVVLRDRCDLVLVSSPMTVRHSGARLPSADAALRLGLRHGLFCLGCCAPLMALLFVGGAMNLAWAAALAGVVAVEKIAPRGEMLGRAAGVAMIGWGLFALLA